MQKLSTHNAVSGLREENSLQSPAKFMWRTREGHFLRPQEMETRHLFFTFLMIWNNSCPREKRVWKTQLYKFSDYYTREYMMAAVVDIGRELFSRADLLPRFAGALNQIRNHCIVLYDIDIRALPKE